MLPYLLSSASKTNSSSHQKAAGRWDFSPSKPSPNTSTSVPSTNWCNLHKTSWSNLEPIFSEWCSFTNMAECGWTPTLFFWGNSTGSIISPLIVESTTNWSLLKYWLQDTLDTAMAETSPIISMKNTIKRSTSSLDYRIGSFWRNRNLCS